MPSAIPQAQPIGLIGNERGGLGGCHADVFAHREGYLGDALIATGATVMTYAPANERRSWPVPGYRYLWVGRSWRSERGMGGGAVPLCPRLFEIRLRRFCGAPVTVVAVFSACETGGRQS